MSLYFQNKKITKKKLLETMVKYLIDQDEKGQYQDMSLQELTVIIQDLLENYLGIFYHRDGNMPIAVIQQIIDNYPDGYTEFLQDGYRAILLEFYSHISKRNTTVIGETNSVPKANIAGLKKQKKREDKKDMKNKKRTNDFSRKPKSQTDTLIDSVSTNDPLIQYHNLEEGTKEYKKAKEFYSTANKINSFDGIVELLQKFKWVGNVYLFVGIFVSIYAMKFDLDYHLKALMKMIGWGDWIVAILIAGGLTTIFKYSLKGIMNNKIRRFPLVVIILSITATLTISGLLYTHYRFGIRMTETNEQLVKAEKLADDNSVESATNKTIEESKARKKEMYEDTKDSLKTAKEDLKVLKNQMLDLDKQYKTADENYKETKDKKWLKDRRKVYQLQNKKRAEIKVQQSIVDGYKKELKEDSSSITIESKKKEEHLATIDKELDEEGKAWRIFLWVIMAIIELLGLMGTLSGIIAILLVPKDVAIELMKLEGNRNAIDMLRAYIDRLEATEIRNSSIHIDNRLNALKVTQSIGHQHTKAVTETMAKNANANNLLLSQFSQKYNIIGDANVK